MVLISNYYKLIYLKNKKSASTSVENLLIKLLVSDNNLITHNNTRNKIRGSHAKPIVIKNFIGDKNFDNYFKICVVKNPYDRLISYFYHFVLKRKRRKNIEKEISEFKKFVKTDLPNFLETYTINSKFICDYHIKYENLKMKLIIYVKNLD